MVIQWKKFYILRGELLKKFTKQIEIYLCFMILILFLDTVVHQFSFKGKTRRF